MNKVELFGKLKHNEAIKKYRKPERFSRDRYLDLLQEIDRLKKENEILKKIIE